MELRAAHKEPLYQREYAGIAAAYGLDPDINHPLHYYDYRAAMDAGVRPSTQDGHWPSQFKADDHPNRYVETPNGILDTKNNVMVDISTNTGRRVPTPGEQFDQHAQGLKTLKQNMSDWYAQAEGTYGRDPEFVMSVVNPPGLKGALGNNTLTAAREGRRAIYQALKQDFNDKRTGVSNPLGDRIVAALLPGKRSTSSMAKEYKEHVKDITSVPDSIMSRIRSGRLLDKKLQKKFSADYNEHTRSVGIHMNRDPLSVSHEVGGHSALAYGYETINQALSSPEKWKAFTTLPPERQSTLFKLKILEDFDRPYFKSALNPMQEEQAAQAYNFYLDNYKRWPSEIFSKAMEKKIAEKVKETKHRLSMSEYLEVADDASNVALDTMKFHFKDRFEELINQKWDFKFKK